MFLLFFVDSIEFVYCLNRDNVILSVKLALTSLGGDYVWVQILFYLSNPFLSNNTMPPRSPFFIYKISIFIYYIVRDAQMNSIVSFGFVLNIHGERCWKKKETTLPPCKQYMNSFMTKEKYMDQKVTRHQLPNSVNINLTLQKGQYWLYLTNIETQLSQK